MATDLRNRIIVFFAVIVFALLFLLPTAFKGTFEDVQWISRPLSLGLDLKGGVHLVYRVEASEAVVSRLQNVAKDMRSTLRKEKVAVTRARANEKNEIEIALFSDRHKDKAVEIIEKEYEELLDLGTSLDGGRVVLRYGISPQEAKAVEDRAVDQAVETLRRRVDQFGVSEPLIQKIGDRRINLQIPGVFDVEKVKKIVGSVAKLEFRLVPNSPDTKDTITLKNQDGDTVILEDDVLMSGDAVADAQVAMLQTGIEVDLSLTTDGGRTFRKLTGENVGRRLAIILDGVVYSDPEIREKISGGSARISGRFTLEEARTISMVLRAGALPAPLTVLEERTVGPTLGKESIEKGILAIIIGFIAIVLFMIWYYRKAGAVAVSILALNVVMVVAVLSAFGATLTLPGLAGLALTVGMAVDANVIIFERIREELRAGSGRDAAVQAGFEKALSAIIDSNLTTLLAGIILYSFGTGPIRGFAVVLSIGILTTIYSATFVARLAFDVFPLKSAKAELSI